MSTETNAAEGPISLDWLNVEFASRCNLRRKRCSLDRDEPSVDMDEALPAKPLDELLSRPGFRNHTFLSRSDRSQTKTLAVVAQRPRFAGRQ